MIVWVIIVGLALILLMAPATAFGWCCGKAATAWIRSRKPPLPPPI